MRNICFTTLPDGYEYHSSLENYDFYVDKLDPSNVIWQKDKKMKFIKSKDLKSVPFDVKYMFWHDPKYLND